MSEESDMEKAIKVRGRCPLPPRFVPVAFLWAQPQKAEKTWSERFQRLPGFDFPGFRGLRFTALGRMVCVCIGRDVRLPLLWLKQGCNLCPAKTEGGWRGDALYEWDGGGPPTLSITPQVPPVFVSG